MILYNYTCILLYQYECFSTSLSIFFFKYIQKTTSSCTVTAKLTHFIPGRSITMSLLCSRSFNPFFMRIYDDRLVSLWNPYVFAHRHNIILCNIAYEKYIARVREFIIYNNISSPGSPRVGIIVGNMHNVRYTSQTRWLWWKKTNEAPSEKKRFLSFFHYQ